jgi:BirA family transcriptional regulator, biotin operon repressor / biotin---[acetyl-CoA-carboxylase] ligase
MPAPTTSTPPSYTESPFPLFVLSDVDSTNAYALRHADALPHGTAIVADRQRSGRGQSGRSWHSPPGNLYMTLLLREFPQGIRARGAGWLTLTMALAVCRVIESRGPAAQIKWPNDVLLDGFKVAGILAECVWQSGEPVVIALGVGVNLNMSREESAKIDRPVSVLADTVGEPIDRTVFAKHLLSTFGALIGEGDDASGHPMDQEVLERLSVLGLRVEIRGPGGSLRGTAEGLDRQGALLVMDDDGVRHRILSGVVTCC